MNIRQTAINDALRSVPARNLVIAAVTALSLVGTACPTAYGAQGPGRESAAARLVASTALQVPAAQPAPRQAVPRRTAAVIAYARAHLGDPYVWGGVGPHGFDCSGLVQKAFAAAGVHLPRGSRAQAKRGVRVSRSRLAVGDLVFSNGWDHVQLYIGNDRVIEAAHRGTRVRISRMLPARLIDAYVHINLTN